MRLRPTTQDRIRKYLEHQRRNPAAAERETARRHLRALLDRLGLDLQELPEPEARFVAELLTKIYPVSAIGIPADMGGTRCYIVGLAGDCHAARLACAYLVGELRKQWTRHQAPSGPVSTWVKRIWATLPFERRPVRQDLRDAFYIGILCGLTDRVEEYQRIHGAWTRDDEIEPEPEPYRNEARDELARMRAEEEADDDQALSPIEKALQAEEAARLDEGPEEEEEAPPAPPKAQQPYQFKDDDEQHAAGLGWLVGNRKIRVGAFAGGQPRPTLCLPAPEPQSRSAPHDDEDHDPTRANTTAPEGGSASPHVRGHVRRWFLTPT